MGGKVSYLSGLAAEEAVARHYARAGHVLAARRWRGEGGEIDLVARDGAEVVFIEVKAARTHAEAVLRVTPAQSRRIMAAAEEFVGGEPRGSLTAVRFDVALVDAVGRIDIIPNAFAA